MLMTSLGGTVSFVDAIIGYRAVASRSMKKDYQLHKVCMALAMGNPMVFFLGRIPVAILQLYYGPVCIIGDKATSVCYAFAGMLVFAVLYVSIRRNDKQLLQWRVVQWNLIISFILAASNVVGAAVLWATPISDGTCFAENSPLK